VPHGRVIHVLDLLKQAARVNKIAFGVTPVSPTLVPGTAPTTAPPPPTK
jgi:hypothetical protein